MKASDESNNSRVAHTTLRFCWPIAGTFVVSGSGKEVS